MKNSFLKATSLIIPLPLIIAISILISSCKKSDSDLATVSVAAKDPKLLKDFTQVNLVGNNGEYDPVRIDPLLVNAWGIAFSSFSIWISAEGTGVSPVYNKDGNQLLPAVAIPSPTSATGGKPTGQVFHPGRGFRLINGNGNPARFIFVGLDGVISGWNGGAAATRTATNPGEVYTGAALARNGADSFLYVANFSGNNIEVYDTAWNEVIMSFDDPSLPAGYSPFNIQTIDNKLYVMYANTGGNGPGNGYINIFNPDGSLMNRFVSRGQLNAPWGIAKAPAAFWGDDGVPGRILVGNFGDGRINVYDADGSFLGQLRKSGNPIVIEGLWGLGFAPATAAFNPNRLYFAAGPDHGADGLFGYLTK